jgi:hypothetical protein
MKIIINKPSDYVIDVELDEEAMRLSEEDLSILVEDAIRQLQSILIVENA